MTSLIKIFMILIIFGLPSLLNAECAKGRTKLTQINGDVLIWSNCSEEGDKYCLNETDGKTCMPKNMFITVEKAEDASDGSAIISSKGPQTEESQEKASIIETFLLSICEDIKIENLTTQELNENISRVSSMKSVITSANMSIPWKYAFIKHVRNCEKIYMIEINSRKEKK